TKRLHHTPLGRRATLEGQRLDVAQPPEFGNPSLEIARCCLWYRWRQIGFSNERRSGRLRRKRYLFFRRRRRLGGVDQFPYLLRSPGLAGLATLENFEPNLSRR